MERFENLGTTCKAKRKDWQVFPPEKQWVEGFLFPQLCDGHVSWCIGNEPLSANDFGEIYREHIDWFEIDKETICYATSFTEKESNKLWTNDIVDFLGHRGRITFECGAYGIAFPDGIDWDRVANSILPETGCDNSLCACEHDNFISLWEIAWNFDVEENHLGVVGVVGNTIDNEELLWETEELEKEICE